MKFIKLSLILFSTLLIFTSCDPDDPDPVNEGELITTLKYNLTPQNIGQTVTLSFADLDGSGGVDPIIQGGTLQANTIYTGQIEILNQAVTPEENIAEEVQEEDEEHQLFYLFSGLNASIEYLDADDEGNPLGLLTEFETGEPSTGQLTIILRHEPDKGADGVSEGDITNAGGETDIEVTFDVVIQ